MPWNSDANQDHRRLSCPLRSKRRGADVNLFMLNDDDIAVGDFVMVHIGYALQKMSEQEARSAWEIYDEMLALEHA